MEKSKSVIINLKSKVEHMMNKISSVLISIVIFIGLATLLMCRGSTIGNYSEANSSFIGRRNDTIKVFAIEPEYVKINELVKIKDDWYLELDRSTRLDNVEIIQTNEINVVSLTFRYKLKLYSYRTYEYNKVITNSK